MTLPGTVIQPLANGGGFNACLGQSDGFAVPTPAQVPTGRCEVANRWAAGGPAVSCIYQRESQLFL